MLHQMLKIGSTFDWISPLFAFFQDATNGPSHTFLIPNDSGWSGREIERMLRQSGVGTWGLMIVGDTLMVSVRAPQAAWAQSLLLKNGVPIEGPMVDSNPPKRRARPVSAPKPQAQAKNGGRTQTDDPISRTVDRLNDFIDSIAS